MRTVLATGKSQRKRRQVVFKKKVDGRSAREGSPVMLCYLETTGKRYIIGGKCGLLKDYATPENERGNTLHILQKPNGEYVAMLYYNRDTHFIKLILI